MTALAMPAAPPEQAHHFRANGWWRDQTFLDDLAGWAQLRPDAPALITGRTAEGTVHVTSYQEFDGHVRRFAGALSALGVGEGDVVAFQLPDWWETAAVMLACMRAGAIAQPTLPDLRERELERVLGCTGATVMITPDRWAGFEHARAIAEMAPRLPQLRHRVVYGDSAQTGAVDFAEHFLGRPDDHSPTPQLDPDRACMVLFTSGSTGEAKGVLHTFNTLYSGSAGFTKAVAGPVPELDRAAITPRICHIAGPLWALFGPLISGGAGVYQDSPDSETMMDLVEQSGTTRLLATPNRLAGLIEAQRQRPRDVSSLHTVCMGGTPIPPSMVPIVREVFGVELRAVWGMTEVVVGTIVGADDPPGWSARSDGKPLPGLEMDIATPPGSDSGTGELVVRGASLCLGTMRRDIGSITSASETAQLAGGWFGTGDLARPDGRGGIRLVGRFADRVIGPTGLMVPVRDVEEELLKHPKVSDVAVISCRAVEDEVVCAVIVPAGLPPTLEELTDYLTGCGMTAWYQPSRLEIVDALPRDHLGKIRKYQLREQFG